MPLAQIKITVAENGYVINCDGKYYLAQSIEGVLFQVKDALSIEQCESSPRLPYNEPRKEGDKDANSSNK